MHKSSIKRIPEVSGFRHTFCRHRSGPSRGSPPFPGISTGGSNSRRESGRDFGRGGGRASQPISEELKKVLSPEACAWLEGKPSKADVKGKGKASESGAQRPEIPPSQEKQMFTALAEPHHSDIMTSIDIDYFVDETRRIPSGTLIEIRRSELAMNAVVLYTMLHNRQWFIHALTSVGEVWHCNEHDVTFQIPKFVSKPLVERCGMFVRPETVAENDARVEILSKLRTFEKALEYQQHTVPERADAISFYDQVVHSDRATWAPLTLRDAAARLLGKSDTLTDLELFAVQSYLFTHGHLYVVENRRFLDKQMFWVRPRQEVSDIRAVTKMVLDRSPALDLFSEKARKIIAESRKNAISSWDEPPSRRPWDGVEWTQDDRTILRFLCASVRTQRIIQKDPFTAPVSHILKMVGMHSMEQYDSTAAYHFLIELGALAPWQEPSSREILHHLEADTVHLMPSAASTPILPSSLSPNDLYSHDVVESLRHDFGDLPVYVIDDWGAEELDDGISIERIPSDDEHHWLHVHIADPTALLPPTHSLARRAMQLSTSRYWVDRTIPMIPHDSALRRFSLDSQQRENVAMSFSMKVNTSGKIVDYKVRPAIVRNIHTIKYDEADALLGNEMKTILYPFGGAPQHPKIDTSSLGPCVLDDLRLLHQVTQRLEAERVRNNALVFTLPKPNIQMEPRPLSDDIMSTSIPSDFRGFPKLTYGVEYSLETGARAIVAEAMKAAGRAASLFFRDRGIPAIRRTVTPLQTELRGKIEELLANRGPGGTIDYYTALAARATTAPGRYVLTPSIHSLMGIPEGEGYMKVTSPLRRFGDMIAHWQIKHALLREKGERSAMVLFDEARLARAAENMSLQEVDVHRSEILQKSFWAHWFLIRWMQDPKRAQREHDPLRTLKARLIEPPTTSGRTGDTHCAVYLHEIGLQARWISATPEEQNMLQLGDEVDVAIHQILLGTRPSIDVKRR